jgi:tRNA(fMet)-specific endonuclease VapC
MSRLVLDTSAYSQFKRGHAAAVDALAHASWVGVPVIVLGELRAGFAAGKRAATNTKELAAFLEHAVVEVLSIDDEAAQIWSEIVVALRRAGTPLPTNDLWIAALAAQCGAPVLTYDAHFEKIGRIGVRRLHALT